MTPEKRLQKLLKECPEWAQEVIEDVREDWNSETFNGIRLYQKGEKKISRAEDTLFQLGMGNIGIALIAAHNNQSAEALVQMQHSVRRQFYTMNIRILYAKRIGNTCLSTLDTICEIIMTALAVGYPDLARPLTRLVLDALNNGYGVDNGHQWPFSDFRYSAMVLSIVSDWMGLPPPDRDKLGLGNDVVWDALTLDWRSEDAEHIQVMLLHAADAHLQRSGVTNREYDDDKNFEFNSPFLALYPAEILAILNLRRSLHLPIPRLDHPLLNTPYAQISQHFITPEIYPDDPILAELLKTISERDPEYLEEMARFSEA